MRSIFSFVLTTYQPTSSFSTMYPLSFGSFSDAEYEILSEGYVKTDDINTYKKEEEGVIFTAKMYHTSLPQELPPGILR